MRCAWQALINLLPVWMRQEVDKHKETLQELRIRLNMPIEIICHGWTGWINRPPSAEDLRFCINVASRYSPWATSTVANGYITCPGGHRIGLCGETINADGCMKGISVPTSICIRVARDYPGIAKDLGNTDASILIIGCPGSGKTTLLRDLIRNISNNMYGGVSVIDERGEIFPLFQNMPCFPTGKKTDILSGCRKVYGIEMLLRSMGPRVIAVDEITAEEDCKALIHAGWCGVKLIATAHAANRFDLMSRPVYQPILDTGLFDKIVVLQQDKTWREERLKI